MRRSRMTRKLRGIGATLAAVGLVAAGCGGGEKGGGGPEKGSLKGVTVQVAAVWSGAEQEKFKKVLDAFEEQTGATVKYTSTGDDIATVLGTQIEGGKPPDVAVLPQPGLLNDLASKGSLKPVNSKAEAAIDANYAKVWKNVDLNKYADEPTKAIAKAIIASGDSFRFDMSDLQPAAFGGTVGKGEWKVLQDFLADPSSVDATATKLEAEAAKVDKER